MTKVKRVASRREQERAEMLKEALSRPCIREAQAQMSVQWWAIATM